MSFKFILRLSVALVFATFAVIFSELIPPFGGVHPTVLRAIVTVWAALMGFAVFPEIASWVTSITISLFNFVITRITSEIMTQFLRLSKQGPLPIANPSSPIGGVALNRPLILDTSAIIDGRVLDIAKTGFLYGTLLVPASVLTELQQIADSSDNLKRARGRRGFEVVETLKKIGGIRLEVWDQEPVAKTVDDKIIKLAKNLHGRILTTDFNLNKVASVSNVTVLNVNDLANAVKTIAIPGEAIDLKIIHVGKDSKQGVGYLTDGTMIVVEDGADEIGKTIKVEVTRNLQGSAGRMIFGKKAQ